MEIIRHEQWSGGFDSEEPIGPLVDRDRKREFLRHGLRPDDVRGRWSHIDFVVDSLGNNYWDMTTLDPTITFTAN